jgi:recombination protein RecR
MFQLETNSLENLTEQFHRLPGVGKKTAQRLALHILKCDEEEVHDLAEALISVKQKIRFCNRCFNITEAELCQICASASRDSSVICIVEDIVDIIAIEKSNEFHGLYHVLGGVISPLAGVSPDKLRISELVERVEKEGTREVLLALNPSTEGEATMIYLSRLLKSSGVKITRIASGIPLGAHLEFIDDATIGRAILTRREVE